MNCGEGWTVDEHVDDFLLQQLQRTMIDNKDRCSSEEGAKPANRLRNRYKDILPCECRRTKASRCDSNEPFALLALADDKHRVILESNPESDYINASFVEVSTLVEFSNEGSRLLSFRITTAVVGTSPLKDRSTNRSLISFA